MTGERLVGVGALWLCATWGCGGSDTAPGSKVGQITETGGSGGAAGTLTLGDEPGGAGTGGGAGGAGGAQAASAGSGGGTNQAGSSAGGKAGSAGGGQSGSSGNGGSASAKPCTRAPGFDADCADFYEDKPQAYTCSSASAASMINQAHDGQCASVSFIEGGRYNACCPP